MIILHHCHLKKSLIVVVAILVGWLASLTPALPAQAQSPITAVVDRTTIAIDEQVVFTVTVSGDFLTLPRPDLSQLQAFVVVSSSESLEVQIENGRMTSRKVFIYRLQPLEEGQLLLGPVSVNIGGAVYETEPIIVEVLPRGSQVVPPEPNAPQSSNPDALGDQDFFVEAEVSNDNPYLGQQIIYTFRLYQAVNFFGQPDYQPPAFTDFWSSEILSQPHYNADVGGREYLVTEILTAIFPANLGEIVIEPAQLIIPGGLFKPDIRLETNPVTVNVQPLPANAPPDFNGAVGKFDIDASLSATESTINEPLTLVVKISGVGNIETLTEPEIPEVQNWRLFESQSKTSVETEQGRLSGVRTFERLVVPGQAGEQTFPSISFSYYNPDTESYEQISSAPIPVTVLPDDSAQSLPLVAGVDSDRPDLELLASDIRHIKPVPYTLSTPAVLSTLGSVVYWSVWVFPLLVMGVAFVWKNRQLRLQRDVAFARSIRAQKTAQAILAEAQQSGSDGTAAAGRALLGYLSDKLNKPTAGLTTDHLIDLLNRSRIEPALVNRIKDVLQRVDIGRFAPIAAKDERTILAETRQLINDLEKALGKPK